MAGDALEDVGREVLRQTSGAVARRDDLGFETGEQPNLSLAQVSWILSFATHGDTERASRDAGVGPEEIGVWLSDPGFRNILDNMLGNKREGVKQIGAQLLPLMLLTLTQVMLTGNNKERLAAIKLQAQMQGLLITQNTVVDRGTLEALREELMRPRPVIRTLPSGTTTPNA